MKNAISRRILTLVLTLMLAAGTLQPATCAYADFGEEEWLEQAASAIETAAPAEVPQSEPEEEPEVLEAVPEEAPHIEEPEVREAVPEEAPHAEAEPDEIPLEAIAGIDIGLMNPDISLMNPAVAYMRPDTPRPDDPELRDKNYELGDKILKTGSGVVPFGKTIYHVVKVLSGKEKVTGETVGDVANEMISNGIDTLLPGAGSIYSVVKDVITKLFTTKSAPEPQRSPEIIG